MIGYIKGRVVGLFNSGKSTVNVVVAPFKEDSVGVAYSVLVTSSNAMNMKEGEIVELWTYSVHSDSDNYLIGLTSKEKVTIFWALISVSGVGPRSAMAILSQLSVGEIKEALFSQDVKPFASVSGIGKKTAAKIVLELSDKELDLKDVLESREENIDRYMDIVATLIKLGYSQSNAKDSVKRAIPLLQQNDSKSTAEKVKLVLSIG